MIEACIKLLDQTDSIVFMASEPELNLLSQQPLIDKLLEMPCQKFILPNESDQKIKEKFCFVEINYEIFERSGYLLSVILRELMFSISTLKPASLTIITFS